MGKASHLQQLLRPAAAKDLKIRRGVGAPVVKWKEVAQFIYLKTRYGVVFTPSVLWAQGCCSPDVICLTTLMREHAGAWTRACHHIA